MQSNCPHIDAIAYSLCLYKGYVYCGNHNKKYRGKRLRPENKFLNVNDAVITSCPYFFFAIEIDTSDQIQSLRIQIKIAFKLSNNNKKKNHN